MNRVRLLTCPRNPASNESTIELRTIALTQGGWDGKGLHLWFSDAGNNCSEAPTNV